MRRAVSCLLVLAAGIICRAQNYTLSPVAGGVPAPTPSVASQASIGQPQGLAFDAAGNLYISAGDCVYRLARNGVLTRVAGTGVPGYSGDAGPALQAQLHFPRGLAVDAAGSVYIADYSNSRVRKVTPDGLITTIAGGGYCGDPSKCDGQPGSSIDLDRPLGIALDGKGSVYFSDVHTIRKVDSAGVLTTPVDNDASSGFQYFGMASDAAGNLYAAAGEQHIVRIAPDGTTVTLAPSLTLYSVAVDASGNLYSVSGYSVVRIAADGTPIAVAGKGPSGYSGDGGPALQAQLSGPNDIAFDPSGALYIADTGNLRVRKVSAAGVIATVAGNGALNYSGDGGPAIDAQAAPTAVALDTHGNLYFSDSSNVIRKIDTAGTITTIAGTGQSGFGGDGGPATGAQLNRPGPIAIDSAGNVYFADAGNYRIRKVDTAGIISTIAGNGQSCCVLLDGPALATPIDGATGVAVDSVGNVYYTEIIGLVRRIGRDGMVATVAGNNKGTYVEGGPAANARLEELAALAVDQADNLYISELIGVYFTEIHKITPAGVITTIAGGFALRSQAQGVPIGNLQVGYYPLALAPDRLGNLFFADYCGVKQLTRDGAVIPVGGSCAATAAGLALDAAGNVYFAEQIYGDNVTSGGLYVYRPPDLPLLNVAATEPRGAERNRHEFSLLVNNGAPTRATTGTVTVTETPPDATVLVSMSGAGWNCAANSCRRDDSLAAGATYPAINVIISGTPDPVLAGVYNPQYSNNRAAVWGGGSPEFSASETMQFLRSRSSSHPKPER